MTAGKVIETARIQLQANPSTYHDYLSSKSVAKHFGARRFADMNDFITQLTFEGHNQLLTAHTLTTDKSVRNHNYCDFANLIPFLPWFSLLWKPSALGGSGTIATMLCVPTRTPQTTLL